jgi:hypothetical protein
MLGGSIEPWIIVRTRHLGYWGQSHLVDLDRTVPAAARTAPGRILPAGVADAVRIARLVRTGAPGHNPAAAGRTAALGRSPAAAVRILSGHTAPDHHIHLAGAGRSRLGYRRVQTLRKTRSMGNSMESSKEADRW